MKTCGSSLVYSSSVHLSWYTSIYVRTNWLLENLLKVLRLNLEYICWYLTVKIYLQENSPVIELFGEQ
jgi:hypothetical protein